MDIAQDSPEITPQTLSHVILPVLVSVLALVTLLVTIMTFLFHIDATSLVINTILSMARSLNTVWFELDINPLGLRR